MESDCGWEFMDPTRVRHRVLMIWLYFLTIAITSPIRSCFTLMTMGSFPSLITLIFLIPGKSANHLRNAFRRATCVSVGAGFEQIFLRVFPIFVKVTDGEDVG